MSGSLTHSPADVVRSLLISLGLGTTPSAAGSWPVYVAHTPDSPDSAITVTDTTGRDDGRIQTSGEKQEHHGFQIAVRDPSHQNGYTKARAIAVAMDENVLLSTVTIGTAVYTVQSVTRTSGPIALGKELPSSKRNLFTINAVVSLRQTG